MPGSVLGGGGSETVENSRLVQGTLGWWERELCYRDWSNLLGWMMRWGGVGSARKRLRAGGPEFWQSRNKENVVRKCKLLVSWSV